MRIWPISGINVTGPRKQDRFKPSLTWWTLGSGARGRVIDVEKEIARLEKELHKTEQDIKRLESKLNNQGFISKAPAEVVEKEKARQKENLEKREGIIKRLQTLKG